MNPHWSEDEIEAVARHLKAIAQPLRLAIVCYLLDGERSVGDICVALGTSQPNASQHLGQLADRGLLEIRKEKTYVYYAIADQRLRSIIGMVKDIYCPV